MGATYLKLPVGNMAWSADVNPKRAAHRPFDACQEDYTAMTNIVVLIKQVPDTWSERKLTNGDFTLDREASDAVLDEINERAVEEALLIKEKEGGESTVTVLTAGPERATEAIRKALSMGADKGVHLLDPQLHGSDMVQTGWALARALGSIEGTDLAVSYTHLTLPTIYSV